MEYPDGYTDSMDEMDTDMEEELMLQGVCAPLCDRGKMGMCQPCH
jgi:hypothetical protein